MKSKLYILLLLLSLFSYSTFAQYNVYSMSSMFVNGEKQPWKTISDRLNWFPKSKCISWESQNVYFTIDSVLLCYVNDGGAHMVCNVTPSKSKSKSRYQIHIDQDHGYKLLYIYSLIGNIPVHIIGLSMIDYGLMDDIIEDMNLYLEGSDCIRYPIVKMAVKTSDKDIPFQNIQGSIRWNAEHRTLYSYLPGDGADEVNNIIELTSIEDRSSGDDSELLRLKGKWIDWNDRSKVYDASIQIFETSSTIICDVSTKINGKPTEIKYALPKDISLLEEVASALKKKVSVFYINKNGEKISDEYEEADDSSCGLASVKLNGKTGYIDSTGKIVIPCRYDKSFKFKEGLAPVKSDGKWGYINTKGDTILQHKYLYADSFSCGLALVMPDSTSVIFINPSGDCVIRTQEYIPLYGFSEDLAPVKNKSEKIGYINKTGECIIPFEYDEAYSFHEGVAVVKVDGKYGHINREGKSIIPCKYDDVYRFSEGLAGVVVDSMTGFVNQNDSLAIPCKFEQGNIFSEGLSVVAVNGKYGYIDKTGELVIPCKYDMAFKFSEGLAVVEVDGKYGYINKKGEYVISPKYKFASDFHDGIAYVLKEED